MCTTLAHSKYAHNTQTQTEAHHTQARNWESRIKVTKVNDQGPRFSEYTIIMQGSNTSTSTTITTTNNNDNNDNNNNLSLKTHFSVKQR